MQIPFHKPIISNNIYERLGESIDSGWLTTGPKVREFEERLSKYLNAKHVIAVNSGTAALHLPLAAIGLKEGDLFIAPTYTFVASVEVGEYFGAHPALVDVDPDTMNLDLDQVESVLKQSGNKVKAIVPVHLAGYPVDMKSLKMMADKYGIFILEDAAHALETVTNAGKVGDTDYAAAFSFYANKNITTGGEGGAVATNNSELAEKIRRLSLHGMSRDGWNRFAKGGKWYYEITDLGYKYNMTDIAAIFGLEQIRHIEEWSQKRHFIVKQYSDKLSKIPGLILPKDTEVGHHAWHLFIIRIEPELWQISRNELIIKINEKGIGTSVHYIPVHMHPYYVKKYNYVDTDFPIAKRLSETVITLPLYPGLAQDQVDYLTDMILDIWELYNCQK